MIDLKNRWESVADREKWAARGSSFLAKTKATKAVWFPPEPVETGTKATKRATKKATKKATGAARKSADGATKVTSPTRRKRA
jgi:hypothetical protein